MRSDFTILFQRLNPRRGRDFDNVSLKYCFLANNPYLLRA